MGGKAREEREGKGREGKGRRRKDRGWKDGWEGKEKKR